jgi:hypothetical protein
MPDDKDAECLEAGERAPSPESDSMVAEANAGRAELVDEQKAHTRYLKEGGKSGITDQFDKPEIVGSEGTAGEVALEGTRASATAFAGDTEYLAELILDKLEEAQDEDTDPETSARLETEAFQLLKTVKTKEDMDALREELEDEDTFRGIDFEEEVDDDGSIRWRFVGDNYTYEHHPEWHFDKEQVSASETLTADQFDQLGEDVAKALRDMGVQRIEVTDQGNSKRIKLKLSEEQKVETGREDVSAVSMDEEVELELSAGDEGALRVTNIDGISAELGGTPAALAINSIDIATNESGEHIANVNAGPFGGVDHSLKLPQTIYDRLFGILDGLK